METLTIKQSNNIKETVQKINKFRLENKNSWYQVHIVDKDIKLKCFDTWIQLSTKPLFSTCGDMTPTEFKNNLTKGLNNNLLNK